MKAIFEPISNDLNQSFHYDIFEKDDFETPWHFHPEFELTFICESSGIRSVGNSIQSYYPEELVLLGSNLPHCWKSNSTKKHLAKSVFIQFNKDLLGEGWMNKIEFQHIKKLLKHSENGLLFNTTIAKKVGKQLLEMQELPPMYKLLNTVEILHRLSFERFETLSLGGHFETNVKTSLRIQKIMKFVESNYQLKINSQQLSALVFMTPVSFSKFFKKSFNKTFTQYLNEYRISKACELLRASNDSIEQIAFETGYVNLSFFHRQFKAITRFTPAQYRMNF
ncbi:AraC family transcriptional regulator [Tamlana fucoidanivorans]|uniref:Helix-turn-helix transcriptional regulator n=1 Tax=Allotamlana fucoidanivorans TaxID=2583814 RepID=A0A5C4SMV6_9FLAO|nr:AraC family transcriptional regulator [Tamlana fucoidanivorans]TNJ45419.1 helix-turn-helix transcriptional regulator [Tamlana fucoidanivorans]